MRKNCWMAVLIFIICISFCSCKQQFSKRGLDELYNGHEGISEYSLTGDMFVTKEFMDEYRIADGDFFFDSSEKLPFIGTTERAFAWMSYDAETYVQAKSAMLDSRSMKNEKFDGKTAYGYTFNLNNDMQFPDWFTAFGYSDDTRTLVFIGLFVNFDSDDAEYCQLAQTNLDEFIQHFFGDYYNWNNS